MLYQNWAAAYSSHVFFQDESHRPDKPASWMCLFLDTALPKAHSSPSHDNPTGGVLPTQPPGALRKEASKAPWFAPIFTLETGGAGWLYVHYGKLFRKAPDLQCGHRETFVQNICPRDREGTATVLPATWYSWGLGSGKASEKFLIQILQNEITVPLQNRNHSCMWKEEHIRKNASLQSHKVYNFYLK